MEKIDILGVKISQVTKLLVLKKINDFLSSKKFNYIVTPNPEIVLKAISDEELFYIINKADLAIPDGTGLKFAALLNFKILHRITGADLVKDVLEIAEKKKLKVSIFNLKGGLSNRRDIEKVLKNKYPNLDFLIENVGKDIKALSREFIEFEAQIAFVNFGAPDQEKFIYYKLRKIKFIKLALGIGGSFDFLTGKRIRAPKFLRFIGLEWLWRLIIQPARIGRIWNAVVVFTFKVLRYKFWYPFRFRPCVACILYKRVKDKYKIFIVERADEKGHWQLPQGGCDKQNLMHAGARELREEINTDNFIPKRAFKNISKYRFSKEIEKNDQKKEVFHKHFGYKGQKQGVFLAEFSGKDEDIKINFWDHTKWRWVDSDKLVGEVAMLRKRGTQKFIKCFNEYIKNSDK